jgi:hypothetical protein
VGLSRFALRAALLPSAERRVAYATGWFDFRGGGRSRLSFKGLVAGRVSIVAGEIRVWRRVGLSRFALRAPLRPSAERRCLLDRLVFPGVRIVPSLEGWSQGECRSSRRDFGLVESGLRRSALRAALRPSAEWRVASRPVGLIFAAGEDRDFLSKVGRRRLSVVAGEILGWWSVGLSRFALRAALRLSAERKVAYATSQFSRGGASASSLKRSA